MCKDCIDESEDRFALARPAKRIDYIYAGLALMFNISYSITDFFEGLARIVHSHRVNEAKKVYLRDELIRDIEKMEKHNG
jgi:hypothetical protein